MTKFSHCTVKFLLIVKVMFPFAIVGHICPTLWMIVPIGTVVFLFMSNLVSVFVIRFLMGYIKKHDFTVFGWYRIVLGILVILYFAFARA